MVNLMRHDGLKRKNYLFRKQKLVREEGLEPTTTEGDE